MLMLYNSDSFAVVQIDLAARQVDGSVATTSGDQPLSRGGYEIVDKFARKEIFLQGALAESFKQGVQALIQTQPSEEEIDDYIGRYSSLMQQPLILQ